MNTKILNRKTTFILIILILLTSTSYSKDNEINSKDNQINQKIWLSKENFFAGEKIRIYSEFSNNNNFDLNKIIEFYDNDKKIGEKKVEIAHNTKIIVWIDTEFEPGKHEIIAQVKAVEKNLPTYEERISLDDKIKRIKIIKIDEDTDGDKIGDEQDTDDDNDGFSDLEEIEAGTNPKDKNSNPKIQKEKNKKDKEKKIIKQKDAEIEEMKNFFVKNKEKLISLLTRKIEINNQKKLAQEVKINQEVEKYKNQEEKKLIESSKKENKNKFQIETEIYQDRLKNASNFKELEKKIKEEKRKINEKEISEKEKEFLRSCLYDAKYHQIKEIIKNKYYSFYDSISQKVLIFLWFIFKSTLLTMIFLLFIFWILWKLIKIKK